MTEYTVKYTRRKNLCIKVNSFGEVTVYAPYFVSKERIKTFVKDNEDFIEKARKNAKNKPENVVKYTGSELDALRQKTLSECERLAKVYAEEIGESYAKIGVRKMRSRWGSCSQNRNLSFNILLGAMPPEVLASVVAHEVCHLKHFDHSKDFYALLYSVFPGYDDCNCWIKEHGSEYIAKI